MKLKDIFDKCRELWGLDSQVLMLAEELNELGVASLHLLRNAKPRKESLEKFAEEIADVEFMLDEMKYYFSNVELIAFYRKKKQERLEKIIAVCSGRRE